MGMVVSPDRLISFSLSRVSIVESPERGPFPEILVGFTRRYLAPFAHDSCACKHCKGLIPQQVPKALPLFV